MPIRILVAVDESPQASAALRHTLSTYPDAEIHALHVSDPLEWVHGDAYDGGTYSGQAFEQARRSAADLLADVEATAAEYDVTLTTASKIGRPSVSIVQYAEEHFIDHIVLGSHGHRGLARFLLGSVAERVARRAPISVTIIRQPDVE